MKKKLFIHHPLFRLLCPLFNGTLVYLLILLINNSIGQLRETFLGEELYICIGLAYLTQEFARWSLLLFENLRIPRTFMGKVVVQLIIAVSLTIVLVSLTMFLYFKNILYYTPNKRELFIFNSIFVFFTLVYVLLYLSHHFLYKVNTHKIAHEVNAKKSLEESFVRFTKEINPALLFEGLETIMVVMKHNPDQAESITDYFSGIYRYMLSRKGNELVPLEEELMALEQLVLLFNQLPYRKVSLKTEGLDRNWVVPTSLLILLEAIIKSTVVNEKLVLTINITEEENHIKVSYTPEEKLRKTLDKNTLSDLIRSYAFYTDELVLFHEDATVKSIALPKLKYHERSHH